MSADGLFRILQIEDNQGDVVALRRSLLRTGVDLKIQAVPKAERALEILRETPSHHFGLILIDINLPGMGGLDFLKLLKTHAISAGTPLFVLTSSQSEADVARAYAHGADGYLVKPDDAAGYTGLAGFLTDIWMGGETPAYAGLRVPR